MKTSAITLQGSCHCQAVRFSLKSDFIFPYQRCYCSICRKTQGGGGYSINLSGKARSLKVRGKQFIQIYHAKMKNPKGRGTYRSTAERHFCKLCGSALWLFSPEWPELIHPFASAIDTPLPRAPESTHMMLEFKASWVEPQFHRKDKKFRRYPVEAISQWHERLGLKGKKNSVSATRSN